MIDINVPPLRFPDFKGEWATTTLGSLVDFKNGINADSSKYGSGIKYISVSDVLDQHPILYESIRGSMIASEDQLREFSVTYGDILFQRSSETVEDIGQANVYLDNKPCLFGGFVIRGKKKADYNPLYMKYALKAPINRKKVIIKGAGAQHYNIGQENLFSIPISICGKEEQAKISSLLSDLDLRIDVQRKIIEDITLQKKSIRSRCFNLENGPFANQRWMSEPISSFLEEQKNKQDCPDGNRLITVRLKQEGVVKNSNFENLKLGETQYYTRHVGEFIYGKQNLFNGAFGIVPLSLDGFSSSGDVPSFSFKGNINPIFFLELIATEYKKMEKYSTGTGSKRIHENQFLSFNILVPNGSVQNKIVCVLASLSKKEELEKKSLSLIESAKSYLLSALFC